MKYDFHDAQVLSEVVTSMNQLLLKIDSLKHRFKSVPVTDLNVICAQIIEEAIAYRKTSDYELLKAYEYSLSKTDFFASFNSNFFETLKNPCKTVDDFIYLLNAVTQITNHLNAEMDFIHENYL